MKDYLRNTDGQMDFKWDEAIYGVNIVILFDFNLF
jgi:hypothetical protein